MNTIIIQLDDGTDINAAYSYLKKLYPKSKITKQTNQAHKEALELFAKMRTEVIKSDNFMTDDEINAEIQAARTERKTRNNKT